MTYILPVLYVIVSYTFFLLAVHFGNAITLQIVSILLPFIGEERRLLNDLYPPGTLCNCVLYILSFGSPFWQCDHIADSIDPSALYHGDRQFDRCADRRKKVVKKDIAELHFDHQVWTDPVLPDRREHHSICNADSILSHCR